MDETPRRYRIALILALAIAAFIAYEPLRHNDFIDYDDDVYVTKNLMVQMGLTHQSVVWAFTKSHASNWHPLTWLSHMLDCQLFGLNPIGHHLTNLLFHIANTLLLFGILKKMTSRIWPSAFVAVAFALHPLHVESVAWVAERKDVLSGFFWMLTIAAYIRYTERPGFSRYLLVFLAFGLGLMAKPMLVTLPFVLLLLDYWPLQRFHLDRPGPNKAQHKSKTVANAARNSKFRSLFIEKTPFLALAGISSIITFVVQQRAMHMETGGDMALNVRIANAIVSYLGYIVKMFYPRHLAVLYPHLGENLPLWQVIVAFLTLAAISAGVIYMARRRRYLAVGWLWYLGTLVPVIGLVQVGVQAMADRYTYLPAIGIFIILTWGVSELLAKWRYRKITLEIAAGIVLVAILICTRMQLRYWQNNFTLFERTLDVTENNFIMHYNYGNILSGKDRFDEAITYYNKTLQINPQYYNAYNNKGLALLEQDKIDDAIACFDRTLELKPDYNRAHFSMGMAMARLDRLDEAVKYFNRALEKTPYWAEAHYSLAVVYHRQGKLGLAAAQCAEALRLDPGHLKANVSLAYALFELGQTQSAIEHYYRILQLAPDNAPVLNDLAWILVATEDTKFQNTTDAIKFAQRACELTQYQQPDLLDTLAVAYAATGNFTEAIKTAEKALDLADGAGKKDLVQKIKDRIKLYRAGQPYREPAPNPAGPKPKS